MLRTALHLALAVVLVPAITGTCTAQTAPPSPTSQSGATVAQDPAPAPEAARITPLASPAYPGTMSSDTRSASGKTIHIEIGHSIFIDTKTRLRRVYVSEPAVLNSVTLTPNQIIVTAMTPGISSLTLLDEAGMAQSYVISSDLDVDSLRVAMANAMRSDSVKVEGSGGRVTLSGTVPTQAQSDAAGKLASLYAKDVANALVVAPGHPKQVRLQVRILEVDRSKLLQLGINLFNPGGNTNFLATATSSQFASAATLSQNAAAGSISTLTTTNPLSFMLYSAKLNLGTTIEDLQTKQVLQILAEPTITAISGVKANFLSGGEFPFPVVQPGSGANSAPVISIQFRPFGVKLEFTPTVNEDGTIRLQVSPEVSALDYSNAVTISGITIPALSTRRADTEVELRSDQSFAISGLLDQRTTDTMSKNPGAASIPILGNLFKAKNQNHSTTELVVVITPTVVDPLAEMDAPSEPQMPVQTLDSDKFDKSLGKRNLRPNPAAPPITPDSGPSVPPVFHNSKQPATVSGVNGSVQPQATPQTIAAEANVVPEVVTPVASTALPRASLVVAAPLPVAIATPSRTGAVLQAFASEKPAAAAAPASVAPAPPVPAASAAQPAGPASGIRPTMVEVMAVSHDSDAEVMVAALKRHGYNVAINHVPQDSLIHLDIGPFADKSAAESMRQRLVEDGYNATVR